MQVSSHQLEEVFNGISAKVLERYGVSDEQVMAAVTIHKAEEDPAFKVIFLRIIAAVTGISSADTETDVTSSSMPTQESKQDATITVCRWTCLTRCLTRALPRVANIDGSLFFVTTTVVGIGALAIVLATPNGQFFSALLD